MEVMVALAGIVSKEQYYPIQHFEIIEVILA